MKKINTILSFCVLIGNAIAQDTVFTEDFQSGIPATWGLRNFDFKTPEAVVSEYTAPWISKLDPLDTANTNLTASSTSFFTPVGTANRWLISPPITVGAYGNFASWKARSHDASYPDSYLVLASKTDTSISSFTDTVGYIIEEYAEWITRKSNLSNLGLNNETIFLAFVLQTNDGFKLYIDDVIVSKEDPVGLQEIYSKDIQVKTLDENGLYELTGDFTLYSSTVYNSLGQKVGEIAQSKVDIRNEKSGLFFISIETDKGLVTKKIIKF